MTEHWHFMNIPRGTHVTVRRALAASVEGGWANLTDRLAPVVWSGRIDDEVGLTVTGTVERDEVVRGEFNGPGGWGEWTIRGDWTDRDLFAVDVEGQVLGGTGRETELRGENQNTVSTWRDGVVTDFHVRCPHGEPGRVWVNGVLYERAAEQPQQPGEAVTLADRPAVMMMRPEAMPDLTVEVDPERDATERRRDEMGLEVTTEFANGDTCLLLKWDWDAGIRGVAGPARRHFRLNMRPGDDDEVESFVDAYEDGAEGAEEVAKAVLGWFQHMCEDEGHVPVPDGQGGTVFAFPLIRVMDPDEAEHSLDTPGRQWAHLLSGRWECEATNAETLFLRRTSRSSTMPVPHEHRPRILGGRGKREMQL